ncbi:MAG: hypothetical protein LLG14_15845 [Nocardiaceae bacterium]|nr:hypothetical protein [Nocardiaceae bacterium]
MGENAGDQTDLEQAVELAAELDGEIADLRILLDVLSANELTPRLKRRINAVRHDLATTQMLRFRLQDRFGI